MIVVLSLWPERGERREGTCPAGAWTCGFPLTVAGIDACLHVVRVDHGAAVAAELARRLVTPPHRDGGQAQYRRPTSPVVRDDWPATLLDWAGEHLHLPLSTADLAAQANVSVRTVERRFAEALGMSPLRWLLQQRVRRAQQFLETSDRPIGWIAATCGFGGPASLRAHFARIVEVSPTAYRRTFHERAGAAPTDNRLVPVLDGMATACSATSWAVPRPASSIVNTITSGEPCWIGADR
jgi:transcriptional regulator GlxA family with amidase domain